MKHSPWLVSLAWFLALDASAGCKTSVEPLSMDAAEGAKPLTWVKLTRTDPAVGAPLNQKSMLGVDLEYQIADFTPGEFSLKILFRSGAYSSRTLDQLDDPLLRRLEHAAGRVHLCVSMAPLYGTEAESLSWPLEVSFEILKQAGMGISRGVASSELVRLNTVDPPGGAVVHQVEAPPPGYERALQMAFAHFWGREALYQTCIERMPEAQSDFTSAYRAWEFRHKADIDWVSQLQLDSVKRLSQGRADAAVAMRDRILQNLKQNFQAFSSDGLRNACAEILADADAAKDGTGAIVGAHLKVLRSWQPPRRETS